MEKRKYETKEYIDEPTGLRLTVVYDIPLAPEVEIHSPDDISLEDFNTALNRLMLRTGLHPTIPLAKDLPPSS